MRRGPVWSSQEDATLMRAKGIRTMDILPHLNGKTECQVRERVALLKLPPVSRCGVRVSPHPGWNL